MMPYGGSNKYIFFYHITLVSTPTGFVRGGANADRTIRPTSPTFACYCLNLVLPCVCWGCFLFPSSSCTAGGGKVIVVCY